MNDKHKICGVYVVTDSLIAPGRTHIQIAKAAVRGGASCVQLREKNMGHDELLELAREIGKITLDSDTVFIVNDWPDIALESGADGVHVGQSDADTRQAREILGPDAEVGVSVASVEEALGAEANGASYVAVSPVFSTATKSDAGEGLGLEMIAAIRQAVRVPVVAIGGISLDNIAAVAAAGADSAAVISAVVCANDMAAAVRELNAEFQRGSRF